MNIRFPFELDNEGRTATAGDDDHIHQMIEQILFTNPGERVNRANFGSGLLQLVFSPNSDSLAAALHATTQAALQQWMGDLIEVRELDIVNEDATLSVTLRYVVTRTNEQRTGNFVRNLS